MDNKAEITTEIDNGHLIMQTVVFNGKLEHQVGVDLRDEQFIKVMVNAGWKAPEQLKDFKIIRLQKLRN